MPETPEQKARRGIDADLTAGHGIAVTNFTMKPGFGFADYLLYVDRKAIGAIEAKPEGALTGVEAQSAKYAAGLPDNLPARKRPLPFLFESNGSVTYFTNGLDPLPRSRQVFNFPRPETLAELVTQPAQLRARLNRLPTLDDAKLWKVQGVAIRNLEHSFAEAHPRALIQMATGSGKTFTAVNVAYRLLKFAGATALSLSGEMTRTPRPFICSKNPADFTLRKKKTHSMGFTSVPVEIMSTVTAMRA